MDYFLLLVVCLLSGKCSYKNDIEVNIINKITSKSIIDGKNNLNINIDCGFKKDSLCIFVENKLVFNKNVTSHEAICHYNSFSIIKNTTGYTNIRISINSKVSYIHIPNYCYYISINYERKNNRVNIVFLDKAPEYL